MYNFENDQIAFETDPQVLANQVDHNNSAPSQGECQLDL